MTVAQHKNNIILNKSLTQIVECRTDSNQFDFNVENRNNYYNN